MLWTFGSDGSFSCQPPLPHTHQTQAPIDRNTYVVCGNWHIEENWLLHACLATPPNVRPRVSLDFPEFFDLLQEFKDVEAPIPVREDPPDEGDFDDAGEPLAI